MCFVLHDCCCDFWDENDLWSMRVVRFTVNARWQLPHVSAETQRIYNQAQKYIYLIFLQEGYFHIGNHHISTHTMFSYLRSWLQCKWARRLHVDVYTTLHLMMIRMDTEPKDLLGKKVMLIDEDKEIKNGKDAWPHGWRDHMGADTQGRTNYSSA